jgi:Domain of unknown function (DUF4351)
MKYRDFDKGQEQEFRRLLELESSRGAKAMSTTWFEEGVEEGLRRTLLRQLGKRFGPLPEEVRERVKAATAERLEQLADAILDAKSLKELGLED